MTVPAPWGGRWRTTGQVVDGNADPGALIKPYSIGKELASWVEKLFETSIPPETIRSRARHINKKRGEITAPPATPLNPPQIPKEPPSPPQDKLGKGKAWGAGPGRPPKTSPFLSNNPLRSPTLNVKG